MKFGKCYKKISDNAYEAYISENSHYKNLGTYTTEQEAIDAVNKYRDNRLDERLSRYGLHLVDGARYEDIYIAFQNGDIFNKHGHKMSPCENRYGYLHTLINGKHADVHRIIATCFIDNPDDKPFVNHINGNKSDNRAENLEWVTRSENTKHSYRIGLQKNPGGNPVYTNKELAYIEDHCFDYYKDVGNHLGRNPESVKKYMYKYRKEQNNNVKN